MNNSSGTRLASLILPPSATATRNAGKRLNLKIGSLISFSKFVAPLPVPNTPHPAIGYIVK